MPRDDASAKPDAHTFEDYARAGYADELIPIIPPGAKLDEKSGVNPSQAGKIPGEFKVGPATWVGMHHWTSRAFDASHIRQWDRWPNANKGLKTGTLLAVDLDCSDPATAEVRKLSGQELGHTIIRGREYSERELLVYRLKAGEIPPHKGRIAFMAEGDPTEHAVEFLGQGGQFVCEGIHPKGGAYVWRGGHDPITAGRDKIPEITAEQWAQFQEKARALLEMMGYKIVSASLLSGGGSRKPIPHDAHLADDKAELVKALAFFPNDKDGEQDHGSCVQIIAAFKAGVGGDPEYEAAARDWYLRFSGNDADGFNVIWNSITDSTIGADWLYANAREHGYGGVDLPALETSPQEQKKEDKRSSRAKRRAERRLSSAGLPTIQIAPGEFEGEIDEAELLLLESENGFPVYSNASRIVEVTEATLEVRKKKKIMAPQIVPTRRERMISIFESVAQFKEPGVKGEWIPCNCPSEFANRYLARVNRWQVPHLTGIVSGPILRADGSVYMIAGYDSETGLIFRPGNLDLSKLTINPHPTHESAVADLKILEDELLAGFPFVDAIDFAVAVSGLLTPHAMSFVPHAPVHGFWSPVPGTGKGKLVDISSVIMFGHQAPAIQHCKEGAEWEKRIDSALLASRRMVLIDNVEPGESVGGAALCTALTQDEKEVRILGQSKLVKASTKGVFWTATGNLLRFGDDMPRRAVLCRLNAHMESPEARQFTFDPVKRALAQRERYLSCILNIHRAFLMEGQTGRVALLGSFEEWSEYVCGALHFLGLPNPAETQQLVKQDDPKRAALGALLHAIANHPKFGVGKPFLARELIQAVAPTVETAAQLFEPMTSEQEPSPDVALREALGAISTTDRLNPSSSQWLGNYIGNHQQRPIGDLEFQQASHDSHQKTVRWQVIRS
jgi:hypothetical protein